MRPTKLNDEEIRREAATTTRWSIDRETLRCERKFAGFAEAMAFVNRVASLAEALNHHPDIDIRYDRVILGLSTHDAGGLTALDFELARQIDAI